MKQIFNVTGVFYITGRRCFVHGEIQEGIFHINDPIKILRNGVIVGKTTIVGIEMINFSNSNISRKDNIGLLLKGVSKEDVLAGDIIVDDDKSLI